MNNKFADVLQFSQESQARQVDNMFQPTVMLASYDGDQQSLFEDSISIIQYDEWGRDVHEETMKEVPYWQIMIPVICFFTGSFIYSWLLKRNAAAKQLQSGATATDDHFVNVNGAQLNQNG